MQIRVGLNSGEVVVGVIGSDFRVESGGEGYMDEVKGNFARYGLLDEQVVFVEGLFQETLPALEAGPFALLRLDADLYESTYIALDALYPRLSPGRLSKP